MKRFVEFLSGRIFVTGVLLAVQLGWLVFWLVKLTNYSAIVSVGFSVLSLLMALYLISSDENPSYKIGWIVAIMALPLLGGLLYLLFGNKRPAKWMRMRLNTAHARLAPELKRDPAVIAELERVDERSAGCSKYLMNASAYPVYDKTMTTYYPVGEDMFRDMMQALEQAEHFIFLEYFIIKDGLMWGSLLDLLKRKAAEGVDVRLMYDDMGSLFLLPANFVEQMEEAGIRCLRFNPFVPFLSLAMNNRDHRKILVIDGHTAFNGGINLSDEYINHVDVHGHWKDTGVRLVGEAVWSFTTMFLEMWSAFYGEDQDLDAFRPHAWHPAPFEGEGFVQPFADTPLDDEPLSENLFIDILARARRYVYIFTPYLIIDDPMRIALCSAAKRGVDVRIATPGIPDKKVVFRLTRSHYLSLIRAGVRIYEYTPGFLHAKSFVSDDVCGIVGTINMDYRSLFLHFECGTFVYGTQSVMALKRDSLETYAKSKEMRAEDCREKFWGRLLDAILRVFAPLC